MDADSETLSEYDTQLYWPLDTSMAADAARRLRQRFLGSSAEDCISQDFGKHCMAIRLDGLLPAKQISRHAANKR